MTEKSPRISEIGGTALRRKAIAVAFLALNLAACERRAGIAEVEKLCAKDSGVTVFDTVYAPGYLSYEKGIGCSACKDALGKRLFEYVDFEVPPGLGSAITPEPGYYRFTVGKVGDPRCDAFLKDGVFQDTKDQLGFKNDECLAVEKLSGRPQGYEYSRNITHIPFGQDNFIISDEWVIQESASKHVLARFKNYRFTSALTRRFDSSGDNAAYDAMCDDKAAGLGRTLSELPQRVLRDPSKHTAAADRSNIK